MKVISYCLWGDHPKYIDGLYRNIDSIRKKLPGYGIYLYVNRDCDIYLEGVIIVRTEHSANYLMFDRFRPVADIVYSRDLDSPLLDREIYAMKEFEESDKMFHIMRDHPYHRARILGGMWGAKHGACDMNKLINNNIYKYEDKWYSDQAFLEDIVYPIIKNNVLIHSPFDFYADEKITPFPKDRVGDEFVGMSLPSINEHHIALRNAENII